MIRHLHTHNILVSIATYIPPSLTYSQYTSEYCYIYTSVTYILTILVSIVLVSIAVHDPSFSLVASFPSRFVSQRNCDSPADITKLSINFESATQRQK